MRSRTRSLSAHAEASRLTPAARLAARAISLQPRNPVVVELLLRLRRRRGTGQKLHDQPHEDAPAADEGPPARAFVGRVAAPGQPDPQRHEQRLDEPDAARFMPGDALEAAGEEEIRRAHL